MSQVSVQLSPASAMPPLRQNLTFRLLLAGNVISILGDGFHSVALALWVLQSTGSSTAMSAVIGTRVLVSILLGAFSGTVVDRSDRRFLMWAMDLVRGILVLGIVGAVVFNLPLAVVLVLSGLVAAASSLRGPAYAASVVNIVGKENVQQAGSLQQMFFTGAGIVGPLLGGAVAAMLGGWVALLGDSLSFFICAAFVLLTIPFPSPLRERSRRASIGEDLRVGFAYLQQNPFLAGLVILAPLVNFFTNAAGILIPVAAVKVWRATSTEFGAVEAAIPLGLALGAAVLSVWGKALRHRGWWMGATVTLFGPLYCLLGFATHALPAYPLLLMIGVGMTITSVLMNTALQVQTQPEVQGRVFGMLSSLQNVASPLAIFAAGTLADRYGVSGILMSSGAAIMCLGLGGLTFIQGLRNYD